MENQAAETQDSGSFEDIVNHAKSQSEPAADKPADKTNGKSDYAPPVDFAALPDDMRDAVEGRINHLSRLMKKQGAKSEERLSKWQQLAEEQARRIEELTSNVDKVVDHVQGNAFKSAEDKLNARLMEAHANGDVPGFIKANAELTALNVKKGAWEKEQEKSKEKPQVQPRQENNELRYFSADESLDIAVESGEMSRPEANAFKSWMDEKDEYNRPVRPWAYTQDVKHPSKEWSEAMAELRNVFTSKRFENWTLDQKLGEMDRRMGMTRTASGQQVMGGNLTTARKSNKVALTTEQETVAKRFKFAGPGKSDAEHFEAYRKQLNGLPKKGDRK